MAAIDAIVEELAREAVSTRRALERVPTAQLGWKPHEKSKTLGQLAWHIASLPLRIATAAQGDDVDMAAVPPMPTPETAAGIVAEFDRQIAEAKALLSRLDDSSLTQAFTMRRGEMKLFRGSRSAYLRFVLLNHLYHHRGQLTVYLRLLDVPVPPIYGPTADES